jgi:hypothetical protein
MSSAVSQLVLHLTSADQRLVISAEQVVVNGKKLRLRAFQALGSDFATPGGSQMYFITSPDNSLYFDTMDCSDGVPRSNGIMLPLSAANTTLTFEPPIVIANTACVKQQVWLQVVNQSFATPTFNHLFLYFEVA